VPFPQLASLFFQHIQLFPIYSDEFCTSFISYASSLYINNNNQYEIPLKYLLILIIFLSIPILQGTYLNDFLNNADSVNIKFKLREIFDYWKSIGKINKTDNLAEYIYNHNKPEISSHNGEVEITDSPKKVFFRLLFYEKKAKKTLLYPFFDTSPELVTPLVKFVLDPDRKINAVDKSWIEPLINIITEYSNEFDFSELLEPLSNFSIEGDADIRFSIAIACWLISDDMNHLYKIQNDVSNKIRNKIESIVANPESYRKRIYKRRKTHWEKIKNLEKEYIKNIKNKKIISDKDYVYILKINYSNSEISRTIAITGIMTLYDLHNAIQEYFNFDNDHLYAFYLNNNPDSYLGAYYSPYYETKKIATKKEIFTSKLYIGKRFLYIFDFGDYHEFNIVVQDIRPKLNEENTFPYLITKKGKAPKQYSEY